MIRSFLALSELSFFYYYAFEHCGGLVLLIFVRTLSWYNMYMMSYLQGLENTRKE